MHNIKYLLTFVFVIGLFIFCMRTIDEATRITSIEIIGNTQKDVYGLQAYNGRSILFTSENEIASHLLQQNVWWSAVTVQKKYPNRLAVSVTMAIPTAYLFQDMRYFLLSESGRVLQKEASKSYSLPTIKYYETISSLFQGVGETIDLKDITKSLMLIKGARKIGLAPDSVDIDSRDMVALQIGSKRIEFSIGKAGEIQLYQLERIVRQFKIEGKTYKRIDLRFDKPIVEF